MAYSKTTWVNNTSPAINETNLNNMETGIDDAHTDIATKLSNVVEDITPQLGGDLDLQTNMIVGEGGSAGIYVDSTGQVGIGTSTPNTLLHLFGNINSAIRFTFANPNQDSQGQVSFSFVSGGYEWIPYVKYSSGDKFSFWSSTLGGKVIELNSNGVVTVPNGELQVSGTGDSYIIGNVGIGTTSPDRLLHAEKTSALTNTVQPVARFSHITSSTPAAGIGAGIEFEQETTAENNEVLATIEAIATDVTAAAEDGALVFKTMDAGAAAVERMRIASDGKVGIGTDSPVNLLTLKQHSHDNGLKIIQYDGSDSATMSMSQYGSFTFTNNDNLNFNSIASSIIFRTNTDTKMRLHNSGGLAIGGGFDATDPGAKNVIIEGVVGIGTTAPGNPLAVNRAADGIIVDFESADTVEGNVSIAGNTTSYNAFVGSHYTQLKAGQHELPIGSVVISTGEIISCEADTETTEEVEILEKDAFEIVEIPAVEPVEEHTIRKYVIDSTPTEVQTEIPPNSSYDIVTIPAVEAVKEIIETVYYIDSTPTEIETEVSGDDAFDTVEIPAVEAVEEYTTTEYYIEEDVVYSREVVHPAVEAQDAYTIKELKDTCRFDDTTGIIYAKSYQPKEEEISTTERITPAVEAQESYTVKRLKANHNLDETTGKIYEKTSVPKDAEVITRDEIIPAVEAQDARTEKRLKTDCRIDEETGKFHKDVTTTAPKDVSGKEYFTYVDTTTTAGDKRVYGVWNSKLSDDARGMSFGQDADPVYLISQVGHYKIRVTDTNGNISIGNYLESSTRPMEAQKQTSTQKLNSTIAKALIDVDWTKMPIDMGVGYKWTLIPCVF